jgi:hypothetical protein
MISAFIVSYGYLVTFLGLGTSVFLGHMKGLEEIIPPAIVVASLLYGLWRQILRLRRARRR